VRIRKNGIEFRSAHAFAIWTEMTVGLQSPRDTKKLECTGVVVACTGTTKEGYAITMLFTHLSRQSQAMLSTMTLV
jgi:hypothetical protein